MKRTLHMFRIYHFSWHYVQIDSFLKFDNNQLKAWVKRDMIKIVCITSR